MYNLVDLFHHFNNNNTNPAEDRFKPKTTWFVFNYFKIETTSLTKWTKIRTSPIRFGMAWVRIASKMAWFEEVIHLLEEDVDDILSDWWNYQEMITHVNVRKDGGGGYKRRTDSWARSVVFYHKRHVVQIRHQQSAYIHTGVSEPEPEPGGFIWSRSRSRSFYFLPPHRLQVTSPICQIFNLFIPKIFRKV